MFKPIYIGTYQEGLIESRPETLLANDAFPVMFNAYVWREKILKKSGASKLGRLRRIFTTVSIGNSSATPWSFNLFAVVVPAINETLKQLEAGSVVIVVGAVTFTDQGNGTLTSITAGNSGTINYTSGDIVLTHTAGVVASTATFNYFPTLPVVGLVQKEELATNNETTIVFDTTYAYEYENGGYKEYIPGTTWTGTNSDFFWGTNYWQTATGDAKYLWVTNFSGTSGDPIRYTDGITWANFAPQVSASADLLTQCLAMLPFRGRLLAFNTLEGLNLANSVPYPSRIRWSQTGNPFEANSWRDDIPGKGGFIDIPTSQDIISMGFVRDNLVVYCERSTWQLRYTGQTIQPFSVEKINTELGSESTFSTIPFEKSLNTMGQTGISNCDSFSAKRIDIKIPDLVFEINNNNDGARRVYGIRDYIKRISYWTYPYVPGDSQEITFPNRRLIYNYENDSFGVFYDSFTALGTFQDAEEQTWDSDDVWENIDYTWVSEVPLIPLIIAGNQLGYMLLPDQQTLNEPSLTILNITADGINPTKLTIPNHNLDPQMIITISGIPLGTPFATALNSPQAGLVTNITQAPQAVVTANAHTLETGQIVVLSTVVGMTEINGLESSITVIDDNSFSLDEIDSTDFSAYASGGEWALTVPNCFLASIDEGDPTKLNLYKYSSTTGQFTEPQIDASGTYVGTGEVSIRDNFFILSKKFNFLEQGQNIRLGYLDVLAKSNEQGEISVYTYTDYQQEPNNTLPLNVNAVTNAVDPLFNSRLPLSGGGQGSIAMQRVSCPTYGAFVSFAWTFSPEQMNTNKSDTQVNIQGHILWVRTAGQQLNRL